MIRFGYILFFIFVNHNAWSALGNHTDEAVVIGGIKQWISIRGAESRLPVMLFLHGGPGNSALSYAETFTNQLEKHFVIVLWDQRETGKTAELNSTNGPLSVELMESDAIEMIRYLSSRFAQDQIYLMGHSWGGFLGMMVAADHPELLKGYLAISPMINQLESERLSLEWMRENAALDKNKKELSELATIRIPFQNYEQLYYHRSWLAKAMGTKIPSKGYVAIWAKKWLALFNEASAVNFQLSAPEIRCPIYFFIGRKDFQTHFKLTEAYYLALKADKKQLFWFEYSGHNLILTESGKFQELVIRELVPNLRN